MTCGLLVPFLFRISPESGQLERLATTQQKIPSARQVKSTAEPAPSFTDERSNFWTAMVA